MKPIDIMFWFRNRMNPGATQAQSRVTQTLIMFPPSRCRFGLFSMALCAALCLSVIHPPPSCALDTLSVVSPDPVLESWRWTTFERSDGLVGAMRTIYEDRDGHVWFGTDRGVQKYDGYRWVTYTKQDGLVDDRVRVIVQTRDGAMWFGTRDGISRFDDQTWITYTTREGLPSNQIDFGGLYETSDGTLWAGAFTLDDTTGTQSGIAYFDPAQQTWHILEGPEGIPRPTVRGMHRASDGAMWFTTAYHGILKYENNRWTQYTEIDGFRFVHTLSIMEASDGAIWFVSTSPSGLLRYKDGEWKAYTVDDGLPEQYTISIWQDAEGTLWASGSGSNGRLCRLEKDTWKRYTNEETPHLNGIIIATPLRDGTIWFCQYGTVKAYRFNPQRIATTYTHSDSLFGGYETSDGSQWFFTRQQAVRLKNDVWLGYAPEDGFLDGEVLRLFQAPSGALWFVGTHRGETAVCRYAQNKWRIFTGRDGVIDNLIMSRRVGFRHTFLETSDGTTYFGGQNEGKAAVCRLDPGAEIWTRYTEKDGIVGEWINHLYEASDGTLWFGSRSSRDSGYGLFRFDGTNWTRYTEEQGLSSSFIQEMAEWPEGTLYVGTLTSFSRRDLSALDGDSVWWNKTDFSVPRPKIRNFLSTKDALWFGFLPMRGGGVVRYDGETFRVFTERDGLVSNEVNIIIQASDGAIWVTSPDGLSRFDGTKWNRYTPDDGLIMRSNHTYQYPVMREMRDGTFWIDGLDGYVIHFDPTLFDAPETMLEPAADQVSSIGNILIKWSGTDRWNRTSRDELRYEWQLNHGEWVSAGSDPDHTFTALSDGEYRFEVRTINRLGRIDATPAVHAFVVEAPWWKNPYVIGIAICLVGLTGLQTSRLVRRDQRLREANQKLEVQNLAMSEANKELFTANQELQRDRAVARIRAEVQAMDEAEDFEKILTLVTEDLKSVGLTFDGCEIDLLNEPVNEPTMAHFERDGFRYTTYTLDPEGHVATEVYNMIAPFPTVIRQTIDRFIQGEPWFGRSDDLCLVEVAAGSYGRLRLTSSVRERFTDEEATMLQEFANAIALGYARYLDIREIQAQTERKSAFLARISHELRTPMNAIKGFANLVRRRETGLSNRGRGNLEKVDQASDHLLAMINDLLDLSKIEAGRMDVNPQPFDVKTLVVSCCATVSPLVADKPEVTLEHNVTEDIGQANTDEGRLRQMLINLLSNAIKFTDKGRVSVRAAQENAYLVLSVSDTGKGIPEDELPTILDEYRQVRGQSESAIQKGTGLGLSITRKFAELLGGRIDVESEVGKGSAFTVRIPSTYEDPC